jgi:hypothetical protein
MLRVLSMFPVAIIDPDQDCHFELPRPLASHTHFDDDGDLVIRCENGHLNGHNPTVTLALGCNNDLKQTASGSVAMAMVEYMCCYTAKLQLDTSVVFLALCASIKALQAEPPYDVDRNIDPTELSRRTLLKATNTLVGKRELSGQQTASALLGRNNHYISDEYHEYWWSAMLRDLAHQEFEYKPFSEHEASADTTDDDNRLLIPADEDDNLIILSSDNLSQTQTFTESKQQQEKKYSTLFSDMFYRPPELDDSCVWDIMCWYIKEKLPKSKTQRKTFLRFKAGHPQYTSHCLKKLDIPVIPVLMGYRIPRNDSTDQGDMNKYAVVVLAMFKPWSSSKTSPLKTVDQTWQCALDAYTNFITPEHAAIIQNMQLLYQTKDAKFDYAARRSKHLKELIACAVDSGMNIDDVDSDNYDPVWENAMQATVEIDDLDIPLRKETKYTQDAKRICDEACNAGFYSCSKTSGNGSVACFSSDLSREGDEADKVRADIETKHILMEKDSLLKARQKAAEESIHSLRTVPLPHITSIPVALNTTLQAENDHAKAVYAQIRNIESPEDAWGKLLPYQQLCIAMVIKHTLNCEQSRAFLLLADKVGQDVHTGKRGPPISILCTGPGGTGKSVIFNAWREYFELMGVPERLRLTAPSGVVASDIGGCTIHSELSLRVSPNKMKTSTKLRKNLEERISLLDTLILDEAYFLGAKDMARISEYLCMAKGDVKNMCGGLNFLTSGDPCQLPPPNG